MTALAHSRNLRWIWVKRLCHSLNYSTVRAAVRSCGIYLFIRTNTLVGFALTAAHLHCLYTNISTDSTPILSPDQDQLHHRHAMIGSRRRVIMTMSNSELESVCSDFFLFEQETC
jgi:hypothetical protein